jgi:hypothetical protein
MWPEKQNCNYRRTPGNHRAKARCGARMAGPKLAAAQAHCMPARPTARTEMVVHPPAIDGQDPVRKAIVTSGMMQAISEPVPIWLAALMASRCLATGNGEGHAVRWNCASGRALYTNAGTHTEQIEPLGVTLKEGHTLAVCWAPGETSYSLEVYRQYDQCA